ncbi:MAG: hypothetical protein MI747_21880 [Desulfobacterales bacterium]|nr:hypothetical protein [Desulfobacterales bacterium]
MIFTLAVGANSLGRDIEKKAYFIVLVRPIGRVDLFLGRAWGMGLFLSFLFFITTFMWGVVMKIPGIPITSNHLIGLLFIFLEWIILGGFSLLFSSFTTPIFHAVFMVGVYYLGHWSEIIGIFADKVDGWRHFLLNGIYFLIPNLELLNFREHSVYSLPIPGEQIVMAALTGASWALFIGFLALLVFCNRKLL